MHVFPVVGRLYIRKYSITAVEFYSVRTMNKMLQEILLQIVLFSSLERKGERV